MRWLCALAVLGCANDPCGGFDTCVAIELRGAMALDQVRVEAPALGVLDRATPPEPRALSLPAQFALVPGDSFGGGDFTVEVRGLLQSAQVAGAKQASHLERGAHARLVLRLQAPGDEFDLAGADLAGADLSQTNLSQTDLSRFDGSNPPPDLAGVDLTGRDLAIAASGCTPGSCASLGAVCGTPSDGCGGTLSCGNPCTLGSFTTLATKLPAARDSFATAVRGNDIYIVGGEPDATVLRTTSKADGTLSPFMPVGTLLAKRAGLRAHILGNYLYALAGTDGQSCFLGVERAPIRADGTLGAFEDAHVELLHCHTYGSSAVAGNRLYLLGGGVYTKLVESAPIAADGTLGAFVASDDLLAGRMGGEALATSGFVYVVGGARILDPLVERAARIPDGSLGTFEDANRPTNDLRDFYMLAVVGFKVFAMGGSGPQGSVQDSIESSSIDGLGALGSFTLSSATLRAQRHYGASAVTAHSVYVMGGEGETTSYDTIERAPLQ